ncbi:MAG: retroviral-like aspartic protease family protein [candidate division WOR-3 bacterium]|nr:retroviral-like aspartic protease family protein [candidate division WOR-3 bacterium]
MIRIRIANLASPSRHVGDVAALIDSGADMSVVPARVARLIALVPKGIVQVQGYRDEEAELRPEYFVRISYERHEVELPVVGDECPEVLLGCDFLRHLVVRLDGPRQELTLEYGTGSPI